MNKKVLTLCAGFLLAGGMLSSLSAEKISAVADDGKYYLMKRVAEVSTVGESAAWNVMNNGYFISLNGDVAGLVSRTAEAKDYWKVISFKKSDGKTYYQLVNLEGSYFYVSQKDGENTLFHFDFTEGETTEVADGEVTFSQLFINDDYSVGQEKEDTDEDGFWKLVARSEAKDGWKEVAGEGFSAEATTLAEINANSAVDGTFDAIATDHYYYIYYAANQKIADKQYKVVDKGNNRVSFRPNEEGAEDLYIAGVNEFELVTVGTGYAILKTQDGKYVSYGSGTASLVNDIAQATLLAFDETGFKPISVEELNYFEKDGFSVTITCAKDNDGKFDDSLVGNQFTGHLTPMKWSADKGFEAIPENEMANTYEFYLRNADGDYIVATKWNGEGAAEHQALYGFTTVPADKLNHHLQRVYSGLDKTQLYFGEFRASGAEEILSLDATKLIAIEKLEVNIDPVDAAWTSAVVGRYDFAGTPTLVASQGTLLKSILITLGSDDVVDIKDFILNGKFVTVVRNNVSETSKAKEGFIVADGVKTSDWNPATDIVASYGNPLEGQWAVTYKDGNYVFTNRENTNVSFTLTASNLYTTTTDRVYRQGNFTYEIKGVAEHAATDGYKRLTDLKNTKFHIAYSIGVLDGANVYFTENHEGVNNHTIGLDADVEDALTFTATEYSAARNLKDEQSDHSYNYVPTDSIYVISYLGKIKDGKYDGTTADTLKVVSYSFVNQWNEPLIYNPIADKYQSQVYKTGTTTRFANVEEAQAVAQKFALREDGEKLNLRLVEQTNKAINEKVYNNEPLYQEFTLLPEYNSYRKVYSGDAANGILANETLYDRTENDLFVIEETEKPMYRRVVSPLDTVSIFRDGNNQSVLFESKGFLGMENLSQFPDIAPGMIADTAYIGNGDITYYRPQYLLAVDAIQHGPTTWCPDHGYGATCQHAIDIKGYLEGRFLVNLKDTAIAWDEANKHKDGNPYINSENYYRLGFVEATHRNDSLIIAEDNNRIYVGDENYNVAKFAFRYVDQEAGSFVIETADYVTLPDAKAGEMKPTYGYLKWMNNVVVVVPEIGNADVYNMNEAFEGQPTANEEISANATVSVVATNGAVIVKGAEGKNVVVSTILGKVVANEVLNSDNETIAAPAGIVVVSVDGESFKVAVK